MKMKRKQNNNIELDKIVPGWCDKVYLMYSISTMRQTFPLAGPTSVQEAVTSFACFHI